MKNFISLLILCIISFAAYSQKVYIKVIDATSEEIIPKASLTVIPDSSRHYTNGAGVLSLDSWPESGIHIEKPGYIPMDVMLPEGTHFVIRMGQEPIDSLEKVETGSETGMLKNGIKVGVWSYFDEPGELALRVNHSTGKVLYLEPSKENFVIWKKDQWVSERVDSYPRFLGSMADFYRIFSSNVRYPLEARRAKTAGTVYVSFEVNQDGTAVKFSVLKEIGHGCGEEVILALKEIPNAWIPAFVDGEFVSSRFILPVVFAVDIKDAGKKFRADEDLPPATMLMEIGLVGYGSPR